MSEYGIVIVSHSQNVAQGIFDLISEVAKDVMITYVGGTEDGRIGTSFEQVAAVIAANPQEKLLAFFDLGSAKMNLEIAIEASDKKIDLLFVPILEGSYAAAALLQANADITMIYDELEAMKIEK